MAMALLQLLLINYVTLLLTDEDPKYPLCFYKSVLAPAMKAFNKNPEIQEFNRTSKVRLEGSLGGLVS